MTSHDITCCSHHHVTESAWFGHTMSPLLQPDCPQSARALYASVQHVCVVAVTMVATGSSGMQIQNRNESVGM